MSDLAAFNEITASIPRPSIWQAAFAEAEAHLADANPAGVDVLDIARAAWDCLPDEEARDEALDALFYGWWEAEQDRKVRAEEYCHPCGCPKRFDRHAWGCPKEASR